MESQESWLELIGDELLQKARSLSSMGVNGVAWRRNDVLCAVEILRDSGYAILGGDVLEVKEESVRFTYDNWYADKSTREASDWDGIVRMSRAVAVEYISGYPEGKRQILYLLVCADCGQYADMRRRAL
jgi:hypothetical protein